MSLCIDVSLLATIDLTVQRPFTSTQKYKEISSILVYLLAS